MEKIPVLIVTLRLVVETVVSSLVYLTSPIGRFSGLSGRVVRRLIMLDLLGFARDW